MNIDELRGLFLFEKLEDDKLTWLLEQGKVVSYPAGEMIYNQGDEQSCFVVLLEGTLLLSKTVRGGSEVEINRTDHRGSYAGGVIALALGETGGYPYSLRAVTECSLFELPVVELSKAISEWFPMGVHLLTGMAQSIRTSQVRVTERERLIALGEVTAGLTHELNNPAAAAVRASAALGDQMRGLRDRLTALAGMPAADLAALGDLHDAALQRVGHRVCLTTLQAADREDELGDWLESHGVGKAWEVTPALVAAGFDVAWAEGVADTVAPESVPAAIGWLAEIIESSQLVTEIHDAAGRISGLISSAKQYSQLDRAPYQRVDLHDLLDSTLAMLADRTAGLRIERSYDLELPQVEALAAELNQVWTNLIDNAISAMDGHGTLTVRTARDGDWLLVEIGDTGPGIPEAIRERIFEPFFTTKPVGQGTGLGLDISHRIVVQRHNGDLRVESVPGDTRFQVRLPMQGVMG